MFNENLVYKSVAGTMIINNKKYEFYRHDGEKYIRLNCIDCGIEIIARYRAKRDLPLRCKTCTAKVNGSSYDGKNQIGKIITEEQRKNMSIAHIGNKDTEETKLKKSESTKRSWEDKEIRDKRLINQAEAFKNEDLKENLSKQQRRLWVEQTEEIRDKRLSGILEAQKNPETIKIMNKKRKDIWNNLTDDQKREIILPPRIGLRPTLPETILEGLLNYFCKDEYRYCGNNDVVINGISPDFININGQKKVIEVFGDYWHGEKITKHSKTVEENERILKFKNYGFSCLIIWEHELQNKKEFLEKVICKILEFNKIVVH